jgi:hypothetical protein
MDAVKGEGLAMEEAVSKAEAAVKKKQEAYNKLQKEFSARKQRCLPRHQPLALTCTARLIVLLFIVLCRTGCIFAG